ncbi:MAG: hypothetical protein FD153_14 [Rhodospirillaceae bacterium]|nr:MAG: hypothetical protein FD153_14 [Rhodospirillaceae bacterium]
MMTPYQQAQQAQREQREQQERQKAHQERLREAWRKTLNDPDGRMVLRALLDSCGLFRSSLETGMERVLILEGQRGVALSIQAQCLAVDPAAYQRLLSEFMGNSHDRNDNDTDTD